MPALRCPWCKAVSQFGLQHRYQAQVDNVAFNYGMWMCANCLRPIVGSVGNEGGVEVPQDYYPQDTHVLTDETELDYGAVLSA